MLVNPFFRSLIILLTLLVVTSCGKDECEFHYGKYFIEFSEESRQQHPFLDKDSIIIESIFGIDTVELKKNLAGEGSRKSIHFWTCASDSTISESYWFYTTEKVTHFRAIGSLYTVAMSLINCPDEHDPQKYSEFFELLVASNFNSPFGDHLRLIRFITNENGAACHFNPLGEFYDELTIGSVSYKNVWYNEGDFENHHFEMYYSTEAGLIGYFIDSVPFGVMGTF